MKSYFLTSSVFDTQTINSQQLSRSTRYWLLVLFHLRHTFDERHDLRVRAFALYDRLH